MVRFMQLNMLEICLIKIQQNSFQKHYWLEVLEKKKKKRKNKWELDKKDSLEWELK